METVLTLGGAALPPLAARGCTQTLTPLQHGEMRRTVNGTLEHIGQNKHFKYRSVITCEDKASPCLEGLWRGQEVEVGCLVRLHQAMKHTERGYETTLLRPPVEGSVVAHDAGVGGFEIEVHGQDILIPMSELSPTPAKPVFVSYAPQLRMRVISFQIKTDEWGAKVGWSLELEEI
jgi:hypothetical protein